MAMGFIQALREYRKEVLLAGLGLGVAGSLMIAEELGEYRMKGPEPARIVDYLSKEPETLCEPKKPTLPLPEGSYIRGSEEAYVIVLKPKFSLALQEDEVIYFDFRQDGDFDHIRVETKAGKFGGKPGEIIKVGLTREEFEKYVNHKSAHVLVELLNKDKKHSWLYNLKDMYSLVLD